MSRRAAERMRSYWDERARKNPVWYVDTSTNFDQPDLEEFFHTGELIVADAMDNAPPGCLPEARDRALEIGSGLGRVCRALATRFDEVVGFDISEEMVQQAREMVDLSAVRFVCGDGLGLTGVEDASVDYVLSFTVFQHMPDPRMIDGYLGEAGRVLRPGGVFAFQWNNTPGALRWRVRRTALDRLQRLGIRTERHERHAAEFLGSRVPLRRVQRTLAAAGLTVCGTSNLGTLYAWCWARKS